MRMDGGDAENGCAGKRGEKRFMRGGLPRGKLGILGEMAQHDERLGRAVVFVDDAVRRRGGGDEVFVVGQRAETDERRRLQRLPVDRAVPLDGDDAVCGSVAEPHGLSGRSPKNVNGNSPLKALSWAGKKYISGFACSPTSEACASSWWM